MLQYTYYHPITLRHTYVQVLEAVCVMKGMKPEYKTEVTGVTIEDYWPASLKLLSDAKFLENLKYYDKENIDPDIMSTIRER